MAQRCGLRPTPEIPRGIAKAFPADGGGTCRPFFLTCFWGEEGCPCGEHPTVVRGQAKGKSTLQQLVRNTKKRLSAFCKLTVTELPEVRLPENPSQAQIDGALEKEGAAILAKLPKGSKLVALCVEGGPPLQPRPGPADGRLDGGRGLPPDLCHWGFLRSAPVGEEPGPPAPVHVPP